MHRTGTTVPGVHLSKERADLHVCRPLRHDPLHHFLPLRRRHGRELLLQLSLHLQQRALLLLLQQGRLRQRHSWQLRASATFLQCGRDSNA